MRPTQYFTKDYLQECLRMSVEERIEFLENFRRLILDSGESTAKETKSKLISIKMPEDLLASLKARAHREGLPYQTLMKKLLRQAL